jgi:hypothetical protein
MAWAALAVTGCLGALLGAVAVAVAYREYRERVPVVCADMAPPRLALCVFPSAPAWLVVTGAVVGCIAVVLACRFVFALARDRTPGHARPREASRTGRFSTRPFKTAHSAADECVATNAAYPDTLRR